MRPLTLLTLISTALLSACSGSEATSTRSPETVRSPVPADPLIPRTVFFGDADRSGVQISPDGTQLTWRAPHHGVVNLWIAPTKTPTKARVLTNSTERPLRSYVWAHDNKHLLYVKDNGGDENFHLYRVNIETGDLTDLTPIDGVRVAVYSASHRRPNEVMIGLNQRDKRFHDVFALNLSTGERTLVLKNPGLTNFEFDLDHNLVAASRPDRQGGEKVLVYSSQAAATSDDPWDLWKPLIEIGLEDSQTTGAIALDESGSGLYMWDSRGRNTQALVRIDIATSKRTLIAEHPRFDGSDLVLHPKTRQPMAVAFGGSRTQWRPLVESMKSDLRKLAKLDDGELELVDADKDDQLWVIRYNRADGPGRYYLWDRNSQQGTFLFVSHNALEGLPLAPMHERQIRSRDGLELTSYLTLPRRSDKDSNGVPDQPLAMVLLVHGGPWSRDRWGYSPRHQMLANRGYAVLSINFRGSIGFGKNFINAANGEWGKKMQTDLLDGVDWAIEQRIARADKICIMGGSYGGYATLVGLSQTPRNSLAVLTSSGHQTSSVCSLRFHRTGLPGRGSSKSALATGKPQKEPPSSRPSPRSPMPTRSSAPFSSVRAPTIHG